MLIFEEFARYMDDLSFTDLDEAWETITTLKQTYPDWYRQYIADWEKKQAISFCASDMEIYHSEFCRN